MTHVRERQTLDTLGPHVGERQTLDTRERETALDTRERETDT